MMPEKIHTWLAVGLVAVLALVPAARAGFDSGATPMALPVVQAAPKAEEKSPVTVDWTLGAKASVTTQGNPQWVDSHAWLKGRAEALTEAGWFFLAEGRVLVLPKTDHRSRDKDLALAWRPKQAYAQVEGGGLTWTAGYQILAWGEADSAAVTDIAAPRDREDLIFKEVEEMRFGQWALAGEIFQDWGSLQLFVSPWAETDRLPRFGNRYEARLPGNPRVKDQSPDFGQGEAGLRYASTRGKWEWALMGGWFRANSPVLDGGTVLHARYPGFAMAGGTATWVGGNVLVKAELAVKAGHPLQRTTGTGFDAREGNLADGMLGLEYTTNDQTKFTLEASHRRIFSDTAGLSLPHRDRTALFLTLGKSVWHDTLDLEYQCFYHLRDQDLCHSLKADYQISDPLTLRGRLQFIQAGEGTTPLGPFHREDRVSVELIYHL